MVAMSLQNIVGDSSNKGIRNFLALHCIFHFGIFFFCRAVPLFHIHSRFIDSLFRIHCITLSHPLLHSHLHAHFCNLISLPRPSSNWRGRTWTWRWLSEASVGDFRSCSFGYVSPMFNVVFS
ncbi:hypothetical protein DM01DRAFT_1011997 [Hesseltinella vesiculosa]|uniref:Uncharacterized protein n=1 Tax=Hesseltinella vesiculosa TaxID=101127 RepID=A0A1X2GYF0_9FUNG|nr:hypothetical protein DM01DRAFT_1011997 [Hesseltinella vesiculosa]